MSIKQSPYLAKQMNGPIVNVYMAGLDNGLKDADTIEDYLYNLSIATAQETELENIGLLLGYPRTVVPDGFNMENILILSSLPMIQDLSTGLADLDSMIGGGLASLEKDENLLMDLDLYRNLLSRVAFIKRYGITLYSVDRIADLFSNDYTISYTEDQDIEVVYNQPIGFKNVWLLTQLFYHIATSPQVIITTA